MSLSDYIRELRKMGKPDFESLSDDEKVKFNRLVRKLQAQRQLDLLVDE